MARTWDSAEVRRLHFGSVASRAEYEQFEISDVDDVNLVSFGLTWTFR